MIEELDVSGGTPLANRRGLRRAVEMVEAGEADVVVVAYFDRLVRSLTVQAEVVDGSSARAGRSSPSTSAITNGRAGMAVGTMLGAVAEYHRRVTAERTRTRSAAPSRGASDLPERSTRLPPA